jgi:hypothetical protein
LQIRFPNRFTRYLDQFTLWRLLETAALFHVLVAIVVYAVGRFQLLPSVFDQQGIGLFALDGGVYQLIASALADRLRIGDFSGWLQIQSPFHVRLYSLTFLFPGTIVGHNILAAEPLNLAYYLGVLTLIVRIGSELFGSKSGLLAAAIVSVWPSFLMHSIHLLRDPLAILIMLALTWIMVVTLKRELSWRVSLIIALAGTAMLALFWMTRGNMWNLIFLALPLTTLLVLLRMRRERKIAYRNLTVLGLLFIAALVIPPKIQNAGIGPARVVSPLVTIGSTSEKRDFWERLGRQVKSRRAAFRIYSGNTSDMDNEVQFDNTVDVLRFLPRATAIGFLAPFPNMWFQDGTNGRAARLVTGAETLTMYALYLAAMFCLWRQRRNLCVWLVFLVAAIGMIALGVVVVNAGALYRLRYVFWILMVVLASEGIVLWKNEKKQAADERR